MNKYEKVRAAQQQGWRAVPSKWSQEQKVRRLGLSLPASEIERMRAHANDRRVMLGEVPTEVDWSNYATPVRDQGNCGSCVAFGVTAAVEAQAVMTGEVGADLDLSEAFLFFCGCGNCCNKGWQPAEAMDFCLAHGLVHEACFPYQDADMDCVPCEDGALVMVDQWHEEYADRKAWVAEFGPVAVALMVYEDFFDYAGGVYRHTYGSYLGGHCVALFGYDSQGWLCKNSWGTGWGNEGWFRIAFNQCGMDTLYPFWCVDELSFPEEPPPPPPPPPDGCLTALAKALGLWKGG